MIACRRADSRWIIAGMMNSRARLSSCIVSILEILLTAKAVLSVAWYWDDFGSAVYFFSVELVPGLNRAFCTTHSHWHGASLLIWHALSSATFLNRCTRREPFTHPPFGRSITPRAIPQPVSKTNQSINKSCSHRNSSGNRFYPLIISLCSANPANLVCLGC